MSGQEITTVAVFLLFWAIIYLLEFVFLIFFIIKRKFPAPKKAMIVHVIAILGILGVLYAYFIEPYWPQVKHIEIRTAKLKESGLTVVQISDLHCEKKIRNERKLPGIVNSLHPDIILFTGDGINEPAGVPVFRKTMSEMKAGLGKFAVCGNYDSWYWKNTDLLGGTGFIELNKQVVALKKGMENVTVSGIRSENGFADLGFSGGIPQNAYNIFMFHYPGMNKKLADKGVDLFLSGHTHGGQVALPFYGAMVTLSQYGKRFEAGRYDINGKVLYVNRGIGMEGANIPRLRFFTRPEITVFHIRPGI